MSLTGELSDLSLAELIEFFCNQRKTGRLKVTYSVGEGYFYLKSGAVIHARFGDLCGVDAVYFALTQSTASFTFSSEFDAPEHSINQPWTSVVLEGLRRMDEGIVSPQPSAASLSEVPKAAPPAASLTETSKTTPPAASLTEVPKTAPPTAVESVSAPLPLKAKPSKKNSTSSPDDVKAFGVLLSGTDHSAFTRRRWHPALIVTAVVLLIAGVGIPWALYTRQQAARKASEPTTTTATTPTPVEVPTPDETQLEVVPATESSTDTEAAELARRQREARMRERARVEQESAAKGTSAATQPVNPAPPTSNKRVTVQVTYDENGRVTAASGGDANALRIARQKRFPPGKPGSATITIPIN